MIQDWLKVCFDPDQHTNCPTSRTSPAPLRLLEVMSDDRVRLVEKQGSHVQYAILSYCWGPSLAQQAIRTLQSNLERRRGGFPLSSLPATLRDSVIFTRHLGIQYIWIDALCIVQDGTEWQAEAGRMMQYYAGAYVTIAPIMCSSADQPFLNCPEFPNVLIQDPSFVGSPGGAIRLHPHQLSYALSDEIEASCWSERGWTLQEKLNSSRVIYVGENGISTQCREERRTYLRDGQDISCMEAPSLGPRFIFAPDASRLLFSDLSLIRRIRKLWHDILSEYIDRQLTFESDRLVAIAGVAERFGKLFRAHRPDTEYVAGLWKDDLCNGLCWKQGHRDFDRARFKVINIGPKSTSWPSWSWCSMNRPVIWPGRRDKIPLADLISIDEPTKDCKSLEVSLFIRSWVFPFEVLGSKPPDGLDVKVTMDDGVSLNDNESKRLRLRAISLIAYLPQGSDERRWKASPISELHEVTGLVLEPVDESEDGIKVHRRVGLFELCLQGRWDERSEDSWDEGVGGGAVDSSFYRLMYASRKTIQLV